VACETVISMQPDGRMELLRPTAALLGHSRLLPISRVKPVGRVLAKDSFNLLGDALRDALDVWE